MRRLRRLASRDRHRDRASTPDLVVHAGDLFDSSRPSPRAVAEALDGFARLREAGIPVVVIAGNHSTPRFRCGGSVFEVLERFGIAAVWERAARRSASTGSPFHAVPHEPDAEQLLADIRSADARRDRRRQRPRPARRPRGRAEQGYREVNEIELDPRCSGGRLTTTSRSVTSTATRCRRSTRSTPARSSGWTSATSTATRRSSRSTSPPAPGSRIRTPPSDSRRARCSTSRSTARAATPAEVLARARGEARTGIDARRRGGAVRLERIAARRLPRARLRRASTSCSRRACTHSAASAASGLRRRAATGDGASLASARSRARAMPKGVDPEAVIAHRPGYLDDAAAEEAEAGRRHEARSRSSCASGAPSRMLRPRVPRRADRRPRPQRRRQDDDRRGDRLGAVRQAAHRREGRRPAPQGAPKAPVVRRTRLPARPTRVPRRAGRRRRRKLWIDDGEPRAQKTRDTNARDRPGARSHLGDLPAHGLRRSRRTSRRSTRARRPSTQGARRAAAGLERSSARRRARASEAKTLQDGARRSTRQPRSDPDEIEPQLREAQRRQRRPIRR